MTTLDILRIAVAATWFVVLLLLMHSLFRSFSSARQHDDPFYVIFWFVGVQQISYVARWVFSWSHQPSGGGDLTTAIGLQVLSLMLGFSVIYRRLERE